MEALKKIKPAFWDSENSSEHQPHEPLDFQLKWKLIVAFTSLMALLPLLVITFIEYRLTRQIVDEEDKKHIMSILSPAANSFMSNLERQSSLVDQWLWDNGYKDLADPDRVKILQQNLSGGIRQFKDIAIEKPDQSNSKNIRALPYCHSPDALTFVFGQGMKKQLYLDYQTSGVNSPAQLVLHLCYSLTGNESLQVKLRYDTTDLKPFLLPFQPDPSRDIFLIDGDGVMITPSIFYSASKQFPGVNLTNINHNSRTQLITSADGQKLITGFSRIPNSNLKLVMAKNRDNFNTIWLKPRLKLVGYLILSIILILISIMGMATYLVGRIHSADQKRVKALHHSGQANKLVSIGRLATGVAHEINNPLAIINEKTGLILDLMALEKERLPNDRMASLAKDVLNAVDRCGTVTQRLLDFTKPSNQRFEPVNIQQSVNQILTFFQTQAQELRIHISFEIIGEPFDIQCNKSGLEQILLNLFNNAFAAMDDGGSLDISASFKKDKEVKIIVSDTGCGIDHEDLHHIFEPFFTIKDDASGTGLGLYVSFGIVKKMGGKIYVESTPGKGTKFTITLPVTSNRSQIDEPAAGKSSPNKNKDNLTV